ncbi:MAG TPA: hypothetical protein VG053_10230 [Solirubrobacteraceae bacterium]|jgi:hypothetical protein|nr:hypothetical protein [Solirubrobacteraceae bacterium]
MRTTNVRRRALAVVIGVVAPLAMLGLASTASATEHHPTGEFAPFADCPLSTSPLEDCVLAETTSGEFVVGKRTVPISETVTLQGGFREDPTTEELEFIGAEDGNTLSKTPQPVPGGLLNVVAPEFLPKWLQEIVNSLVAEGLAGVTATTELAAPASHIGISTENLLFERGIALSLPVKIKLNNVFLGENCYIGSNAAPVVVKLTTGTTEPPAPNKPITGTAGVFSHNAAFTLVTLTGSKLVDNSFAAPKATGCGGLLSLLINPAVNAELGLPAAAGTNTAILEGDLSTASAKAVKASE